MRIHPRPLLLVTGVLVIVLGFAAALGATITSARSMPVDLNAPVPAAAHLQLEITPRLQDIFAGDTANLTVTITNDGGAAVSGLSTSGSSISACNKNSLGSLAAGQSTSYTCQKSSVGESSLEVMTVSGSAVGVGSYQQTSDAFIKVSKPELIIIKRPTNQVVRPGGTARFTIGIRNEGPTVLANVRVLDSAAPDCEFDPAVPLNLAPGERREYTCSLTNVDAQTTSVATVQGTNPGNGSLNQASDASWIDVLDLQAGLVGVPAQVDEPGAEVTFTASVTNPSGVPLTLIGLSTNKFGNLFDQGNELVPAVTNNCLPGGAPIIVPPNGAGVACNFVAVVSGQPSDFSVVLTACRPDGRSGRSQRDDEHNHQDQ